MSCSSILALMGSPMPGGNTDILIDTLITHAQKQGATTVTLRLYSMNFRGCIECGGCDKTGICILQDDFTPVYERLLEADYVVAASPMFFYNISSAMQAAVERSQALWMAKYRLNGIIKRQKPGQGVFIGVGATKGKLLFEGAQRVMKYFFDAIDLRFAGSLLYRGIDAKGEIKGHETAMNDVTRLAEAMARGEVLNLT
ncbi:MAG: flavodoxin family protein [Dissulfuribacterales bacterium]